eukprot:10250306-Ditylum_brightwellii.AAC.1
MKARESFHHLAHPCHNHCFCHQPILTTTVSILLPAVAIYVTHISLEKKQDISIMQEDAKIRGNIWCAKPAKKIMALVPYLMKEEDNSGV